MVLNHIRIGVVMGNILITKEVAEMLRVSEEYVRELIRQRKLKAYKEGIRRRSLLKAEK